MPHMVDRPRRRPIFKVDPSTIPTLITQGARIIKFQEFLGGKRQCYMTLVAGPEAHYMAYSPRPLLCIIQKNGRVIPDSLMPIPPTHYHPS